MSIRWLAVLALGLLVAAPAVAQGQGEKGKPQVEKGKSSQKGKQAGKEKEGEKEKAREKEQEKDDDSKAAQRELKNYYEKGGARPADLPPGIAKNLERGKPLPPGIQKSKVPGDLASKLPKRPGEEWSMIGDRLVSVDKGGVVRQVITP